MRRMKIEVLIDDGNKINKESFFILDPDKIKIEIYTNSSQASVPTPLSVLKMGSEYKKD
jgi:hypothetical protein